MEASPPRRIEKPWGYELCWAESPLYLGKLLFVKEGHELSLQLHLKKDETSFLLSGRLVLTQGPDSDTLQEREVMVGELLAKRARSRPLDQGAQRLDRPRGLDASS